MTARTRPGASTADARPLAGRREWTALTVLILPLLLVSMDVSVLYFAVPFISRDLEPSAAEQLWIFDIYGFVLAGLLITMGSLGDRIGRRKLLMIGAAAFGAASVGAAYASNVQLLILCRALLGVGGATLMPSTLALIRNMFHDERQRSMAIAIWTGVMTGGVALGPVLSGILLEHFWWGSVFLINTPFMLALLILAPVLLPEFKDPNPGRFDPLSAVLSLAAVLPIIYGIKTVAVDGIGVGPALWFAGGLLVGVAFVRRQLTLRDPMIDLGLFGNRVFSGSLLANAVAMFALVGNAIFMTQYLQSVLGFSPLRAALWSLAPSVLVGAAAPTAGLLARRFGRTAVMAGGLAVAAGGFLLLSFVELGSSVAPVLIGAAVLAAGLVGVLTLVTEVVMAAVNPERAGVASAMTETISEFGGALGIAILGSLGAAVYSARLAVSLPVALPSDLAGIARDTLGGAVAVAAELPGDLGITVLTAARQGFVDSIHTVAWAGAAVLLATALITVLLLRAGRRSGASVGQQGNP